MGGLGLLEFKGMVTDKVWPFPENPDVVITNLEPNSFLHYQSRFKNHTLTHDELRKVQKIVVSDKLVADDVRGLGSVYRDLYKEKLLSLKGVSWRKIDLKPFPTIQMIPLGKELSAIRSASQLAVIISNSAPEFGEYRRLQEWWSEMMLLAKVRKVRPIRELEAYSPSAYLQLRKLERWGLHRATALDYMFGNLSGLVLTPLSPLIASAVQSALSRAVLSQRKWTREMWGWFTSNLAVYYAEQLNASDLSVELFQW